MGCRIRRRLLELSMAQVLSPAGYRFLGLGDLASLALAFYMQQLM